MHDIRNKACGGKRAALLCRTGQIIERDINIVLFAFLPGGSGPFLEVLQYRAGNVCANLCHTWCNECTHF